MRLGKTALSHFLSQIVVTLSGFVATWIIAYILGASDLGVYAVVVSLGFFWLVIPGNAVAMAVKKRISEGDETGGFIGGGLLLNTITAVLLSIVVLVSGDLLGGIVSRDRELMRVLIHYDVAIVALLVVTLAYRTAMGSLQGQKRVATTGWLKGVERVGRTAFQAGALVLGLGVAGISFAHAAALGFVALLAFSISRQQPTLPSVTQLRSILNYAKFAWVSALRSRVFGWLDTIFLSFFVGSSLIGIYEVSWGIASMLAIASASISQTLFPEVSDLSTAAGYDRIRHYLNEALTFGGILVIPGLAGATVIGERVLRFYGPEFGKGSTVLLILISAYIADTFASQFTNVINGVDRPDAAFRVNIVFITCNVILNGGLIWAIGWHGAAIATAVSSGLRAVAGYFVLARIIGYVSIPYGQLSRQALASITMAGLVTLVVPIVPNGRLGTILLAGFGAVVYALFLLLIAPRVRSKTRSFLPDII